MIHPDPKTFTPDAAADASSDVVEWARGVLQRQAALLERLAEAGVEMVVSLKQREIEEPSASPAEEEARARAVARIGRCVRLTAALQTRLVKEVLAIGEAGPAVTSVVAPIGPASPQDQLRERVGRVVTRIIRERSGGGGGLRRSRPFAGLAEAGAGGLGCAGDGQWRSEVAVCGSAERHSVTPDGALAERGDPGPSRSGLDAADHFRCGTAAGPEFILTIERLH